MAGELNWYRQYWRPWGSTIGYHDVATYRVSRDPDATDNIELETNSCVTIHRHYNPDGTVKHYCVIGHYADSVIVKTESEAISLANAFAKAKILRFGEYVDIRKISSDMSRIASES